MKKNILLGLSLVACGGSMFAQQSFDFPSKKAQASRLAPYNGVVTTERMQTRAGGDPIYSDDFSNFTNWTVGTTGQGTFILGTNAHAEVANATTGLNPYMGNMASTSAANGFAFFNGVQYLLAGSVDIQNTWVASPVIDFTGVNTALVSFEQRYRAFNSDVTYIEYSPDGGANWTYSEVVNGAVVTNASSVQNTVSVYLPVNGSANGMIRFRWENTSEDDQFGSGYGWMVDDLEIVEGYDNDLQLSFIYSAVGDQVLQYTHMPVAQATAAGNISFGAQYKNVGNVSQDVQLHVTSGAFDQTGTAVTTAAFAEDSVSIETANGMAIPTTVGVSDFNFELVSNNTLSQTGDDSDVAPFQVSEFTYAVDGFDGTAASMTGFFTTWSSPTGDQSLGTLFEIFEADESAAIQVGIGNVATGQQATYNGREFFAQIFQFNGTTFDYLDETPTHILAAGDYGKLITLNMDHTVDFQPGLYLVVVTSFAGAPVPVAFSGFSLAGTTIGVDGGDFVTLISDDATPNLVEAPVVRIDFKANVGTEELTSVSGVSVAPNPFGNSTEISFDLANDSEVSVVVTDLTGRVVLNIPATNYTSGAHKVSLDGSSLNSGVYNYTLKVGNDVVTKRIVKK